MRAAIECDTMNDNNLLKAIIAFFLPPLAVFLERGLGMSFLINILLTALFWLPGFIHALMVVYGGKTTTTA